MREQKRRDEKESVGTEVRTLTTYLGQAKQDLPVSIFKPPWAKKREEETGRIQESRPFCALLGKGDLLASMFLRLLSQPCAVHSNTAPKERAYIWPLLQGPP